VPNDGFGEISHTPAAQSVAKSLHALPQDTGIGKLIVPNLPQQVEVRHVLAGSPGKTSKEPEPLRVSKVKSLPLPDHRKRHLVQKRPMPNLHTVSSVNIAIDTNGSILVSLFCLSIRNLANLPGA
jgi:hypothetical protein